MRRRVEGAGGPHPETWGPVSFGESKTSRVARQGVVGQAAPARPVRLRFGLRVAERPRPGPSARTPPRGPEVLDVAERRGGRVVARSTELGGAEPIAEGRPASEAWRRRRRVRLESARRRGRGRLAVVGEGDSGRGRVWPDADAACEAPGRRPGPRPAPRPRSPCGSVTADHRAPPRPSTCAWCRALDL